MPPLTYDYEDLCAAFKYSAISGAFRKRLKTLASEGFPPPLPGTPQRWSKSQVDAWLRNPSSHITITGTQQGITLRDVYPN
jgi:hypothetical protein